MVVQTKEHVLSLLQGHREHIRNFGVRRLGLFGSFARQQQGAESDVDVLVEFEPGHKTFDAFMQLAFFLEELFERRVELVSFDACIPAAYLQGDAVPDGPVKGTEQGRVPADGDNTWQNLLRLSASTPSCGTAGYSCVSRVRTARSGPVKAVSTAGSVRPRPWLR